MGRRELSRTGPADEAETPAPLRPLLPLELRTRISYRRLLQRRLAHQTALAEFARRALNATTEPLRTEATVLAHQVFPAPGSGAFELLADADEDDVAFASSVADILRAASSKIEAASASQHASLHDPLTSETCPRSRSTPRSSTRRRCVRC